MKRLMLASLALILALIVGSAAVSAQTPADGVILAKAVWGTPQEIDGVLDDGWAGAGVYENESFVGVEENETDISAKWRVMYDNAYIYFFVEVEDESIGDSDYEYCPAGDYYNKNSVHMMFDLGYERGTSYDTNDFYIDISSYGYYNCHTTGATDFVTSATQITDDGYTVEVRLDFAYYDGFAAEEGTCFGYDLWANDNLPPLSGRLFCRTWADSSDSSWNNPSMMGTVQLGAKPADAVEVTKDEVEIKIYPNIENDMIPSVRPGTELRQMGVTYTASTNGINPQGGGSKDIAVIADGENGSRGGAQYDTFGAEFTDDMGVIWFAVEFDRPAEVSSVIFWEGGHWGDGGWFGASPFLQVLNDGKWSEVDFTLTPDYPGDSIEEQSPAYDPYFFTLNETVTCDGVRVLGAPNTQAGGHASCSEIEVYGPGEADPSLVAAPRTYRNIEEDLIPAVRPGTELKELGVTYTASTNAENPQGGGAKDIAVIADGSHEGTQYDTYGATLTDDIGAIWFALAFDQTANVEAVVFWEGGHWWDGGWFGSAPYLETFIGGEWVGVNAALTPDYPEDNLDAQSPDFDAYIFTFETPVVCDGIRVLGAPNTQAGGHASCSEVEVYGSLYTVPRTYRTIEEDAIPALRPGTELKELGVTYTASTNAENPQGGGAKDIAVIADGSHEGVQYDTYGATLTDENGIWFGVEFGQRAEVSSVVFWEGGHWWDGGWFGSAPYVEVLVGGEWTKANATLTPEYPEDNLDAQNPDFDAYIFTLEAPIVCEGIRVVGAPNTQAGGHASCSEIEVYGSLNVPADSEPEIVVEEPETTGEPEPVQEEPETPAPVDSKVDEELEAKAEAPQTFDFGVFAAIAACISLTGFAVSKKKK